MKRYIAEVLGTFTLVLFGTMTAVLTGGNIIATALAFGLALVAMIYAVGGVSGGHFNPAVSLAQLIRKEVNVKDFLFYVVSQLVGALVASLLLMVFLGDNAKVLGLGANQLSAGFAANDIGWLVGLLVEVILTFVFVFTIIGVTRDESRSQIAGLVIGLVLVGVVVAGFAVTGTSVNPARSLAPALLQGGTALEQVWIFLVGPLLGGALAGLAADFLLTE